MAAGPWPRPVASPRRAGHGWSGDASGPRDGLAVATELHAAAGEPAPNAGRGWRCGAPSAVSGPLPEFWSMVPWRPGPARLLRLLGARLQGRREDLSNRRLLFLLRFAYLAAVLALTRHHMLQELGGSGDGGCCSPEGLGGPQRLDAGVRGTWRAQAAAHGSAGFGRRAVAQGGAVMVLPEVPACHAQQVFGLLGIADCLRWSRHRPSQTRWTGQVSCHHDESGRPPGWAPWWLRQYSQRRVRARRA